MKMFLLRRIKKSETQKTSSLATEAWVHHGTGELACFLWSIDGELIVPYVSELAWSLYSIKKYEI